MVSQAQTLILLIGHGCRRLKFFAFSERDYTSAFPHGLALISYYHLTFTVSVKTADRGSALPPITTQMRQAFFKRFRLHHKEGIDVNNYLGGGGSRGRSHGLQQLPRKPVQHGWLRPFDQ